MLAVLSFYRNAYLIMSQINRLPYLVQQCFLLADLNIYKCGTDVGTFLRSLLIGEKIYEVNFNFKMQIKLH